MRNPVLASDLASLCTESSAVIFMMGLMHIHLFNKMNTRNACIQLATGVGRFYGPSRVITAIVRCSLLLIYLSSHVITTYHFSNIISYTTVNWVLQD